MMTMRNFMQSTRSYARRFDLGSMKRRANPARAGTVKGRRHSGMEDSRHQIPVGQASVRCGRAYCRLGIQKIAESAKPQRRIAGRRDNLSSHERIELFAIVITRCGPRERAGGGMNIDLAQAVRQVADQTGQTLPGHLSGPLKSEDAIGCKEAGGAKAPAKQKRKRCRQQRRRPLRLPLDPSQHRQRLERYASRAQAEATADRGHQPPDHRVEMEMLVRVAMIEGEARGAKGLELCRDFGGELAARLPAEAYDGPKSSHIRAKDAISIHEMRDG